jgi:signal transduction histidine kinase/ActR/RegA family two-component response regulator
MSLARPLTDPRKVPLIAGDPDTPQPEMRWSNVHVNRTMRSFAVVLIVVVLGISMSLSAFFVARNSVQVTNGHLLRQDAAQGALVLNQVLPSLTGPYEALGATLTKSGPTPAVFIPAASPLAATGASVALLQDTNGHLRVIASVGHLHHQFGTKAQDHAIQSLENQTHPQFVNAFIASGQRWLTESYGKGIVPAGYLIYSESPIDKVGSVTKIGGILFMGTVAAVYAGSVTPANLVLKTATNVSTTGQLAVAVVGNAGSVNTGSVNGRSVLTNDVSDDSSPGHVLVVMQATGPLAGNSIPTFPWILLIVGLLATLSVGTLLMNTLRRRNEALVLVSHLEVKNTELDEALVRQAQAENSLRQAQRMEAVGQLAGGIAHDFNNLLQAIISYSEFMSDAIDPDSEMQRDVTEVLKAAHRAADLTRQLLVFSRQDVTSPTALNLNHVILDSERFLRRTIGEDVRLTCEASKEPNFVVADSSELEMILVNLSINARDAMPRGGAVRVSVDTVALEGEAALEADLAPGRYARLRVSDTGDGMSPETAAKAFEPFFTTKDTGRGTGLGLSMVYGIVKRCGGGATISTALGSGTTITLFFPLSDSEPDPVNDNPAVSERKTGRGVVLLVEDQEGIRRATQRILEAAGYDVVPAEDAISALDEYSTAHIDVLVTDVIMPRGMSGKDLADRLRLDRPALPVVFVSGYSAQIISERGILPSFINLVVKPFTPDDILEAVSDALNAVAAQ